MVVGVGVGIGLVVERFSCCLSGAAMLKICGAPALFKEQRREEVRGLKSQKKKERITQKMPANLAFGNVFVFKSFVILSRLTAPVAGVSSSHLASAANMTWRPARPLYKGC